MNTKGMKFLAVLAVLAMAFAAIAVITFADDSDAVYAPSGKYDIAVQGPLNFAATNDDAGTGVSNAILGNNILVSYDAASKTYTVTGTLAKQKLADTTTAFYELWPSNATTTKEYTHGIVFGITATGSTKVTFSGDKAYDYGDHFAAAADTCLIYVKSQSKSTVTITGGTYAGKYTIDLTGVTLSSTETTGNGYVALANSNALAGITAEGTYRGTDGANGSWSFTINGESVGTLVLDNYNGNEYFSVAGAVKFTTVKLVGNNTINSSTSDAIIQADTNDVMLTISSEATASLKIVNNAVNGKAIGNPAVSQGMTLGNAGEGAPIITFDLTAHNRALNSQKNIVINNAILTATGGEKCICSQDGAITIVRSTVVANLGPEADNGIGTGDRFAIKAKTLDVQAGSNLTTDGLRVTLNSANSLQNAGIITVKGDYMQSTKASVIADLKVLVAGLHYPIDAATAITAYATTPALASYILLTDNAGAYGNVEVKGSGTEVVQKNEVVTVAPDADQKAAIVNNINTALAETVQLVNAVAGAVDLTTAAPINVSEEKSLSIVNSNGGSVSANIKVDDKTVKLQNITGAIEISKGSIKVYGDPWTAGTITLTDGDVAKISGTVDAVTFNFEGTGSAKIIVEKDTVLSIGTSLTIASDKITMEIEGIVTAPEAGKDLINGSSKVVIKDGAVVEKIDITGSGDIEVYSGSDINSIGSITDLSKVKGKDAASGTWSITRTGTGDDLANAYQYKLVLNSYNGTYNFGIIPEVDLDGPIFNKGLTAMDLTGDSVVSYAFPATYANGAAFNLFGDASVTSITTSTSGSLEIDVDVSKVAGDKLFTPVEKVFTVISGDAVDINGVDIDINVTGTNGDWTDDQKKAANVVGIKSTTFNTYNANVTMDILSSTTAAGVIGLNAGGVVTIGTGNIDIKVGGTALKSDAAVTISNTTSVSLVGKKVGLQTTADAVTIQSVPAMTVSGGINTRELLEAGAMIVKESNVTVAGASDVFSINETNTSDVKFTGKLTIGAIGLTQQSSLTMKDAIINGVITNGGNIKTTGNVIINGDSSGAGNDANSTFVNEGTIALFGKIANQGQFTNSGSFTVFADAIALVANHITVSEDLPADATKARLGDIEITEIKSINVDGTATVKATLAFQFKAGDAFVGVDLNKFEGTLTPSQTDAGFTLTLSNGSASVNVQYNASKAGYVVGESYTITVSGAIKDAENNLRYLEANKTGTGAATITAHTIDGLMTASNAAFTATKGKITSTGSFTIYSPATATIATEFEGDLVADIATKLNINGKFTGDITSNGASEVSVTKVTKGTITAKGDVSMAGTLTGDIISDGKVTVTAEGTMTGDITAKDDVSIGKKQIGNITVNANDKKLTVNGEVDGILTYNSAYKATKDATETTTYTATMAIKGTGNFVINLAAGADATASTEVVPGFFTFQSMAVVEDKSTEMTLTAGKLGVPADFTVPVGYSVVIEAGTTIEVAKTATLNVEKSALKVSEDATANFEIGGGIAVTYGKVSFVMSFTIEGGAYTIYSNVAYALSNCDEDSELTVGKSDVATSNIDVKKGVNIIVDSVTLDFDKYALTMAEGAKITLMGTGKVVFKETGQDLTGDEYVYYTVSGTIVYDDVNIVELNEVRFSAESQFTGIEATESAPSKINATMLFDEGFITIDSGYVAGTVVIGHDHYCLTKADDAAVPKVYTLVSGTFAVSLGTVFDAIGITDCADIYDDVNDKYTDFASFVCNDGTIVLNNNTNILGSYVGPGYIVLKENISLTVAKSTVATNDDEEFVYGASLSGFVVDSTDDVNGYAVDYLMAGSAGGNNVVFKAEKNGSDYYVTISGVALKGDIESLKVAKLKIFTLLKDVTLMTEATDIMTGGVSVATGKLITKTINMAPETGYGELVYDTTYEYGDYTVYTQFDSINFEEVSEITIANNYVVADDMDLSGNDVTIYIAEGKKIIIDDGKSLILGTPITSLSGETIIVGKIALGDGSYIVAYSDVDLLLADIVSAADETIAAKNSTLTIEDELYATIFANAGEVVLAAADEDIVPEIEGYNFTKWNNLNENPASNVGQTNAYAGSKAKLYTIYAFPAEGVTYYLNGVEYGYIGVDQKIEYGKVFTAKINDLIHYTGTPLINGELSYVVTGDDVLIVTGVELTPAAITYTVTANYADGVTYYLDGIEFAAGVPQEVAEGSIINAKITDTNNYTGTPLVNGQHSMKITQDVTITVTGVQEKTVTPESEWGITTILLLVLVILIAFMAVVIALRLNRS